MKRFVFPLLCAVFILFVWFNRSQADEFWQVLQGANPVPVLVALALQAGTLLNQPALFQSLYTLVGIEVRWRELLPVVLSGRFLNVVAPAAGLGETALLFEQAKRRGWDIGRIVLVTTLYFAFNFAVFFLILLVGLSLLALRGDLEGFEVLAALPLALGLLLGCVALLLIAKQPQKFGRQLSGLTRRLPRRLRQRFDLLNAPENAVLSFSASLRSLRGTRGQFVRPTVHAFLVDLLEMAVLGACMEAFGVAASLPLLVAAYAIGTLFTIVSISPQGLGVVEGAIGAVLVSFGVPLSHATAIVLLYRGLSFWLPLLVGFAATRFWSKTLSTPGPPPIAGSAPLPQEEF